MLSRISNVLTPATQACWQYSRGFRNRNLRKSSRAKSLARLLRKSRLPRGVSRSGLLFGRSRRLPNDDWNRLVSSRSTTSSAAQASEINDHCDQQPQEIDPRGGHAAVDLPGIHDRGQRKKDEPQNRKQQAAVERALQVIREQPDQEQHQPGESED